ncbi:helicase SRCAP isoform X2 [Bufo gargarizans]|uniref:helicase SRCAP isoform X2 n=1 Tax=Bufo gargarizans TaxID=30331 RepID=UPI001CF2917F|nr:helicase SRCAP isoform X2 [Bufo gargarizans]
MESCPPRRHMLASDILTSANPPMSPDSSGELSPFDLSGDLGDICPGSPTDDGLDGNQLDSSAGQKWDNHTEIAEQAKHEAEIENRIAELRKEGFWTPRRLSKFPEPTRPKVQWDYLCEEMQWLAADFGQERRWKRGVARKVVRMVVRHHEELKQKEERARREEQAKLRRIATSIAKEVRQFWTNVEKVVQFKQQSRLEEKRKKALDLQLDFIVGQTEKYSDLLSQSLSETIPVSKTSSSCVGSSQGGSLRTSPAPSICRKADGDGDFLPHDSEEEEEDDEATIEIEEQQEGNDAEAHRLELELLKRESELPLDELLQNLPPEVLQDDCLMQDPVSSEEGTEEEEEEEQVEEEDDEFTANEDEAEDEEDTIAAEEEMAGQQDHAEELSQLARDGEMSLDELLLKYSVLPSEAESPSQSEHDSAGNQEEYGSSDCDSSDRESEGVEFLLKLDAEEPVGDTLEHEPPEPKKEITDIAATAESLQPKGYTLATTQVKTAVPFLLHGELREYQHIGLEWLVTMYEKKLNGILADEMGLGKTIQTISLLAHLACERGNWGPHLIIVPTSVILNWEMELKRWCPSFKILTYYGSQKERKLKRQGWTKANAFHVCITSYKLVLQDHQAFRRKNWKYLILDEAQNIKNFKSQRWQSLLNFNSQRRLLLTGTPLQNSLMELWSLMHFLMPHVFQSHREFKEWFSNPLTGMIEGSQEYNEGLVRRLHKVLRPFLLRRIKQDVEKQMPKKYEHVIYCRLSKRQRFLYDDFMSQAATRETLASGHFMSVINILMQLRKVCNHPNLFDPRPIHSPFITSGICYTVPSLVLHARQRHPLEHIDMSLFDLINMEGQVSRYERDVFLPHYKQSRPLIQEIAESPEPPPRPRPLKMKVNRMLQPVKSESRSVVVVNNSQPMRKSPDVLPTPQPVAPQSLTPSTGPLTPPPIPAPKAPLPVQFCPVTTSVTPVSNGAGRSVPVHSAQSVCSAPQRLILTPDMQARLPSGEIISLAQLAALGGRPLQSQSVTKPLTLQLQGTKLTLTGAPVRPLGVAQPRPMQGNVLHLVSSGGQHHLLSQPAQLALIQALAQQAASPAPPVPQLVQSSAQGQMGVQALSVQSLQHTLLNSTNLPAAPPGQAPATGVVKIVVRQSTREVPAAPQRHPVAPPVRPLLRVVPGPCTEREGPGEQRAAPVVSTSTLTLTTSPLLMMSSPTLTARLPSPSPAQPCMEEPPGPAVSSVALRLLTTSAAVQLTNHHSPPPPRHMQSPALPNCSPTATHIPSLANCASTEMAPCPAALKLGHTPDGAGSPLDVQSVQNGNCTAVQVSQSVPASTTAADGALYVNLIPNPPSPTPSIPKMAAATPTYNLSLVPALLANPSATTVSSSYPIPARFLTSPVSLLTLSALPSSNSGPSPVLYTPPSAASVSASIPLLAAPVSFTAPLTMSPSTHSSFSASLPETSSQPPRTVVSTQSPLMPVPGPGNLSAPTTAPPIPVQSMPIPAAAPFPVLTAPASAAAPFPVQSMPIPAAAPFPVLTAPASAAAPFPVLSAPASAAAPFPVLSAPASAAAPFPVLSAPASAAAPFPVLSAPAPAAAPFPVQSMPIPAAAPFPVLTAPASAAAPFPVLSAPASAAAPFPVLSAPASAAAPFPVLSAPASAAAPFPVLSAPASAAAPFPVLSAPASAAAPFPVLSAPAPAAAPFPVLSAPAPAAAPFPVLSAPAPAAAPFPVLSAPAPAAAPFPVLSAPAPAAATFPVLSAPAPAAAPFPVLSAPAPAAAPFPVLSAPAPAAAPFPVLSAPAPATLLTATAALLASDSASVPLLEASPSDSVPPLVLNTSLKLPSVASSPMPLLSASSTAPLLSAARVPAPVVSATSAPSTSTAQSSHVLALSQTSLLAAAASSCDPVSSHSILLPSPFALASLRSSAPATSLTFTTCGSVSSVVPSQLSATSSPVSAVVTKITRVPSVAADAQAPLPAESQVTLPSALEPADASPLVASVRPLSSGSSPSPLPCLSLRIPAPQPCLAPSTPASMPSMPASSLDPASLLVVPAPASDLSSPPADATSLLPPPLATHPLLISFSAPLTLTTASPSSGVSAHSHIPLPSAPVPPPQSSVLHPADSPKPVPITAAESSVSPTALKADTKSTLATPPASAQEPFLSLSVADPPPVSVAMSSTAESDSTVEGDHLRPLHHEVVSTSLRLRRQLPPPPRSPFYLEPLEERRRKQKLERLERIFHLNERRSSLAPVYGTEVLRFCTMQPTGPQTDALGSCSFSAQQRLEQLAAIIERFIFAMPPVEAPQITLHTSHPPPSLVLEESVFKDRLSWELTPHTRCLHRIISNMRTQFPDLRLIQYDCGKLQTLDRLLRQLKSGGHRVLLFTQMTRMLDVLEQFLNYHGHIYLRLDGSTRVEQRQVLMERFNMDKRIFCFILSTRSGGVGVNLTGADTVIFYDSDWNPTMDAQAQDRCHRIGQTRDVHIYRLVSERTVEENILKKAQQKRLLGDMAIEGGNFTTAYFKQHTIRELFDMEDTSRKEAEVRNASPDHSTEDGATSRQEHILEQALCGAEDEEDTLAASLVRAEQVADLAEFNENVPLDPEEEEQSRAEQEISALVEQLTPIERYAMYYLEASLEEISKEELKQAEEQVEAARKDLFLAKDEAGLMTEEKWDEETRRNRKVKTPVPSRPTERVGVRMSERLRGSKPAESVDQIESPAIPDIAPPSLEKEVMHSSLSPTQSNQATPEPDAACPSPETTVIQTPTMNPLSTTLLPSGLSEEDTIPENKPEKEDTEVLVTENVADTPVRSLPGSPVRSLPGSPVRSLPGSPVRSLPGSPVRSLPGSPVRSLPGSPVRSLPGSPVRSLPGSPVRSLPGSPVRSLPGSPVRSVPGSPVRSVPGSPVRSVPGSPVRSVPGSPVRSVPGSPVRSVPGSPAPPRRKVYADCEITLAGATETSPTAKVLRRLPGRLVTVVQERLPTPRRQSKGRVHQSGTENDCQSPDIPGPPSPFHDRLSEETSETGSPPPKRKRGRPRKAGADISPVSVLIDVPPVDSTLHISTDLGTASQGGTMDLVTRSVVVQTPGSPNSSFKINSDSESGSPIEKRKRGRPPKRREGSPIVATPLSPKRLESPPVASLRSPKAHEEPSFVASLLSSNKCEEQFDVTPPKSHGRDSAPDIQELDTKQANRTSLSALRKPDHKQNELLFTGPTFDSIIPIISSNIPMVPADGTSSSGVEEPVSPPKRKRGRPPKSRPVFNVHSSPMLLNDVLDSSPERSPSPQVTRTSLQRKCKPLIAESLEMKEQNSSSLGDTNDSSDEEVTVRLPLTRSARTRLPTTSQMPPAVLQTSAVSSRSPRGRSPRPASVQENPPTKKRKPPSVSSPSPSSSSPHGSSSESKKRPCPPAERVLRSSLTANPASNTRSSRSPLLNSPNSHRGRKAKT